ncbi:hypothetical protein SCG7086_AP_00020 [Chlamydiales bacterium SCGC AG-110-P3]|nr:hypothetical protein SCG7086_AP_00020 [Chlamydiales bacterium SCGC AG-110-P3]
MKHLSCYRTLERHGVYVHRRMHEYIHHKKGKNRFSRLIFFTSAESVVTFSLVSTHSLIDQA